MGLYLDRVIAAIRILDVEIKLGIPQNSLARFANNGSLFLADWEIELPNTIAAVPDDIVLHESIHALNRLNGIADNSVLDEQIAQSVSEFLAAGRVINTTRLPGITRLQNFEFSYINPGTAALGVVGIQAEWDSVWVGAGERTLPDGTLEVIGTENLAGSILSTRYSDRLNSGVQFERITDADWTEVEMHSIDLSCSQLADHYSSLVLGVTLTCPALNTLPSAR